MYVPATAEEIEAIFAKRLNKEDITKEEELKFKTAFMQFVAKQYHKRDWVMQIHYGCRRDNNTPYYKRLGPDTGYDCINNYAPSSEMADMLNALSDTDALPKTILYSLNPNDNESIGTIIGCFQNEKTVGRIQQGSAWWFNDHKVGMTAQMTSLANLGILSNFVGMLTDSRSFLSYTRHEYFRRILCELIGGWVDNGEYPDDYKTLDSFKELLEKLKEGGMETPTGIMKEDWSLAAHFLAEVYEQQPDVEAFVSSLYEGTADLANNEKFNSLMDFFDVMMENNYAKDSAIAAERETTEMNDLQEGQIAFNVRR